MKNRKFRIDIFILSFITISILTFLSVIATWGRSEGTLEPNDSLIWNFIADSFDLFAFPSHPLFSEVIGSKWFFSSFMVNVIFWSIVAERLITIGISLIRKKLFTTTPH